MEDSVVVLRSNKRANVYNQQIRNRILWYEDEITSGDHLMVVKNNYFALPKESKAGFIANGDQAGFMQYMNKLQRKKDEETRQNRAGNGGKVSKSTSSSKAKGGGGDKSKSTSRRARGGSKFGTEEDMMEEMMMTLVTMMAPVIFLILCKMLSI